MIIERPEDINVEGALLLRNAIIEVAAEDYLLAKRSSLIHTNPRYKKNSELTTLKRWFISKQFNDLGTSFSGNWLMNQLDKKAELEMGKGPVLPQMEVYNEKPIDIPKVNKFKIIPKEKIMEKENDVEYEVKLSNIYAQIEAAKEQRRIKREMMNGRC